MTAPGATWDFQWRRRLLRPLREVGPAAAQPRWPRTLHGPLPEAPPDSRSAAGDDAYHRRAAGGLTCATASVAPPDPELCYREVVPNSLTVALLTYPVTNSSNSSSGGSSRGSISSRGAAGIAGGGCAEQRYLLGGIHSSSRQFQQLTVSAGLMTLPLRRGAIRRPQHRSRARSEVSPLRLGWSGLTDPQRRHGPAKVIRRPAANSQYSLEDTSAGTVLTDAAFSCDWEHRFHIVVEGETG